MLIWIFSKIWVKKFEFHSNLNINFYFVRWKFSDAALYKLLFIYETKFDDTDSFRMN